MTALRLSYGELAERLGVTSEAARAVVRRRGWQRVQGNNGRAVVLVEEAELDSRPGARPPVQPPGRPDAMTGPVTENAAAQLWQRIAEIEAQRDHMAAELLVVTARAARAEGEAVALRDALADLAGRLDAATAELRRPWWWRLIGWT